MKRSLASAVAIVAASSFALAIPPAGAQTKPKQPKAALRLRQGTYQGKLIYAGNADFQDRSAAVAAADGTLDILVPEQTSVIEGTFTFTGPGMAATDVGSGNATLSLEGVVTGRADDPWLDAQSGSMTGSATVQGITVPIDAEFDAASLGESDLKIESASACQVAGRFALEVPGAVAGAGGSANVDGRWQVVRTGSLDAPEEVWTLMGDAEELLADARAGNFDRAAWQDLVRRASRLESELQQDRKCKASGTRGLFISGVIDDLLDYALLNSDTFTAADLERLLRIAKSDGAFADPTNPKRSRDLRKAFHDHFVLRLDTILNSDGIDADIFDEEIEGIWLAGDLMGWDDVADQAKPYRNDGPPTAP